jgi:hypothetical protein
MIGGSTQYPLTRSSRSATSGRRDLLKAIAERNPTSGENKETPSPPACSSSNAIAGFTVLCTRHVATTR